MATYSILAEIIVEADDEAGAHTKAVAFSQWVTRAIIPPVPALHVFERDDEMPMSFEVVVRVEERPG